MVAPWYRRLSDQLSKSREALTGHFNVLMSRKPAVDDGFWSELEDALIASDMGVAAVDDIIERLRRTATRQALPDAAAVLSHLAQEIADEFPAMADDPFAGKTVLLVVGVNGSGKTTTVGKLAKQAVDEGRNVLLGSADTFRAAANEQLEVWADRAGVPVISRSRGEDPAAVAFDTVAAAKSTDVDLTLIDTAGRLHTSVDLMRELEKVQRVVKRASDVPVKTVLVMDATTGQNGLAQARQFHSSLNIDGLILTKLDGTAKGGIVVAISRELRLPVLRIGFGEDIGDLRPFIPLDFASALVGVDPQ